MQEQAETTCVSCGAVITGPFCAQCGERRLTAKDRTVTAFFGRALEEFTDVDSRLLKTLRALIFSPGKLTVAFRRGERVGYIAPLQLFLLINVFYFFIQPYTSFVGYNTKLDTHQTQQIYSDWLPIAEWAGNKAKALGVASDTFETLFNYQSEILAPTLVLLMVPMFALVMRVLLIERRDYFVDHIVFAVHFFAFQLLTMHCLIALIWPKVMDAFAKFLLLFQPAGSDDYSWIQETIYFTSEAGLSMAIILPYVYIASRRFYALGIFRALFTTAVAYVLIYLVTFIYRFLLLALTFATI
ncbi:MAG: DUF3667 domain-containing protein [Pseudomonadota bacterium]